MKHALELLDLKSAARCASRGMSLKTSTSSSSYPSGETERRCSSFCTSFAISLLCPRRRRKKARTAAPLQRTRQVRAVSLNPCRITASIITRLASPPEAMNCSAWREGGWQRRVGMEEIDLAQHRDAKGGPDIARHPKRSRGQPRLLRRDGAHHCKRRARGDDGNGEAAHEKGGEQSPNVGALWGQGNRYIEKAHPDGQQRQHKDHRQPSPGPLCEQPAQGGQQGNQPGGR